MIISTQYGKIEGIEENGCNVYKGIPYAKPPVGKLRFRKPQKPECWEGVYKADHFRARSMQTIREGGFYYKEFYSNPEFDVPVSEDSLYLNIWVPEHSEEDRLPVAVYIHGGAFLGGAGSNLPFVCSHLAESGVIVVTVNYRLGVLGFLCHPLLRAEGENAAGGNFGLWDQLAAIKWVKENIAGFDGNPDNITVFGQSAGAMSLQLLALSEKSRGAFEKMILQSGGGYKNPLAEYPSIERASEIAEEVLEELGIHNKEWMNSEDKRQEAIRLLHETPVEVLMEASGKVLVKSFQENKGFPFIPVVDGELLISNGNKLIEEGKYLPIQYMLGANGNDITTENEKNPMPENNMMHKANIEYAEMVNHRKDNSAFVYYFDRKLPGDDAGAFHSAELWYVFGSLEYCWRPLESADYELSARMITCWSNFMKNGDPDNSENGEERWRPCTEKDPYFKVFDVD